MQNPDHVDPITTGDEVDQVTADGVAPILDADVVGSLPAVGLLRDSLDRVPDLQDVGLGLVLVPVLERIVPDRRQIALRGRSEPVCAYARLEAMNESKSNASGSPLSSPATRAARRALNWVSRSSSSRRPARTTSLAER